jgi:hypothetical protein
MALKWRLVLEHLERISEPNLAKSEAPKAKDPLNLN